MNEKIPRINFIKEQGLDSIWDLIDSNKLTVEKIQNILEVKGLEYEDSLEVIEYFYNKGIRPQITVPKKYSSQKEKEGFYPKQDWERENEIIAGTFLIDTYSPVVKNDSVEIRETFKINVSLEKIKPRLTGSDKKFHGVVIFDEFISPEDIELIK